MTNESKWITAIGGIVAALVPLLVAYGALTTEQAELWEALILAIVAAVVPIVVTSLARNYNDNAAMIVAESMALERARLESSAR
jgi:hypothetical protein